VASIYEDGTYLAAHPSWHVEDAPWKAAQVMKLLSDRPRTLCEVGCGVGAVLALLADAYEADAVGYDISPPAILLARERERPGLSFRLGSPDPGERFDVVLVLDVIEHVEDPFSFLRGLHGLGDKFVCHLPLELSAQAVLRARFARSRRELGHLHFFSEETALDLFRDCGFEVDRWMFAAPVLDRGGKSTKARLASLPRRILWRVNPRLMSRTLGGASLMLVVRTR
jgi:SAM-dependent methyltransferase